MAPSSVRIWRCGAERLNGNIAVVCKADGKSGVRKELHRDFLYHMADVDRHAKSRTLNAADRRSLLAMMHPKNRFCSGMEMGNKKK